jgi:hypothetical protein
MTVLTKDRNTPKKGGNLFAIPVAASTKIYAGSLVCSNATGYAVPGADTAGLLFRGIAQEFVDNSAGADGEKKVLVEHPVIVSMSTAGITQADIGKPVFIADDQTVAKSTTNSVCCGVIREVISATSVWLDTFYSKAAGSVTAVAADNAAAAVEDKVSSTDAAVAAGAAPTKEEFDAVVTLINELKGLVTDAPSKAEFDAVVTLANANKAAVNGVISKLKNTGLMA